MRIIAIYPGRFQPFHIGHYLVYKYLAKQFGEENTFIISSPKKDNKKSPFSFQEKSKIITTMFDIPQQHILYGGGNSPYEPTVVKQNKIMKEVDFEDTAFVYAVGEKDDDRIGGTGYEEIRNVKDITKPVSEIAYIMKVPMQTLPSGADISGTKVRKTFRSGSEEEQKELFLAMYDKFDDKIFSLLKNGAQRVTEGKIKNYTNWLQEGGAFGHMAHIFDDIDLTFGDWKQIITMGLTGNLNKESEVTVKIDGQNMMVSWKNGGLVYARNDKQLANYGSDAPSYSLGYTKSRIPEINKAFSLALININDTFSKLPNNMLKSIFQEGKCFLSLEIIYQSTQNVIWYGKDCLVFHTVVEYDEAGNAISENKEHAKLLTKEIMKIKADMQNHFKIEEAPVAEFGNMGDVSKKIPVFIGKLQSVMAKYNMNDSNTLKEYIQGWYRDFINENIRKMKLKINTVDVEFLIKRWSERRYGDVPTDDIREIFSKRNYDEKTLDWLELMDVSETGYLGKLYKEAIQPFEYLIGELATEILLNLRRFLSINPDETINKLKTDIDTTVKKIKDAGVEETINKMKEVLKKIDSFGGMDKIMPEEGIVFVYKNKLYKFTGLFSPINNLLGMLRYGR